MKDIYWSPTFTSHGKSLQLNGFVWRSCDAGCAEYLWILSFVSGALDKDIVRDIIMARDRNLAWTSINLGLGVL